MIKLTPERMHEMRFFDWLGIGVLVSIYLLVISNVAYYGGSLSFSIALFFGLLATFSTIIGLESWENYNEKKDKNLLDAKGSAPPLKLRPLHQHQRPMLKRDSGPLDF